jgi:predicted RNA-binding Zn-ribbon protein involved in translation (DUF1610 family)
VKKKIASQKDIEEAINQVFKKQHQIISLKALHELVNNELKKKLCKVSMNKLKKSVIGIKGLEIKIKKRRMKGKQFSKCPVCGNGLDKIFGRDAFNRKKDIGFKCKRCGFKSGLECSYPREYIFLKKL